MIQWRDDRAAMRQAGVAQINAFAARATRELVAQLSTPAALTKRVHVMLGNEAADADSIVSSLVYAFHRDHVASLAAADSSADVLFVPVLPIPRNELALRCDVTSLFAALGIDATSLLFADEFPWRHPAFRVERTNLRLTLLDHNALNTKRLAAEIDPEDVGEVVEILDHHMDQGKHAEATDREIAFANGQALVASCCTLVAEKILDDKHEIAPHVKALSATMLLGVIALDSVNFNPDAKKVTPRDIAAADRLEKVAFADRGALFDWLQAEKFNVAHWSAFSVANCLQCDYKEFEIPDAREALPRLYGVSAILIPLESFVLKAATSTELLEQLRAYCLANNLAFLVVMSMSVSADGTRSRQIMLFEENGQAFSKRCVAHFEQVGSLQLEPMKLPFEFDERVSAFQQRNTGASRKQVVPLIQEALADVVANKL